MALLHRAQITPTKLEVIADWLPRQTWFAGRQASGLTNVGAYRFDDPEGEVGVETLLVGAGDEIVQVPMTYRGSPPDGSEPWLMGTMEHSVLGRRWVYDAAGDPVYRNALAAVMLADVRQAEEFVDGEHGPTSRTPSARVVGSRTAANGAPSVRDASEATVSNEGALTAISSRGWTLTLRRLIGSADEGGPDGDGGADAPAGMLHGTWAGQEQPRLLAWAQAR